MDKQCKPLVASLVVDKSPSGTLRVPDAERRVLLEQTPQGRSCKLWKPERTPEIAGTSGCSRPKKARRSLKLTEAAISRALHDSGSSDESEDGEGDGDFVDFWMLRHRRLGREEDSEDEWEERVEESVEESVEERVEERVEESVEESVLERVEERVVQGEERVEERGEGRVEGVNVRVQEDAELRANGQEFVDSNDFSWSEDFSTFTGQKEVYLRTPGPSSPTEDPVEIFMKIWNKDIMEEIVRQTNKYAWEKIAPFTEEGDVIPEPLSTWIETSSEELYRYFGILVLMSGCHMSVVSDYWTTGLMGMPDFRRLMTRNRFLLLTRLLHFVDNDDFDPRLSSYQKKVLKIKPILDHCNAQFLALYTPKQHLSLDESLLLWKGRLSWVQCIRSKAARFGIKSFELCESESGYLLRCLIYAGKNSTMFEESIHGFGNSTAKVVLELMDGFLDVGHILVMDNWYNQLSLTRFLKRRGTDVIGTMNARRVNVPNEIKQAKAKKMPRGDQIARHCGDITLIAWQDVKLVTAVSTCHTDAREPASRAGVSIEKPVAIAEYNKFMGGVDSKDQKLSMYLMERKRGRKWYMKVFKRLLNTSLLNSFIIYQNTPVAGKRLTHRQFRGAVATGLLERFPNVDNVSRPNVSDSAPGIPRRLMKGVEHFVEHTELKDPNKPAHRQQRCARCTAAKRRTGVTLMCSYCKVPLCAGICWREYHTLQHLIFSVSTAVLAAGPPAEGTDLPVNLVGRKSSQGLGIAVDPRDDTIIFSPLTETAIAAWNPITNSHKLVAIDPEKLQFCAEVRWAERDNGAIWALSTRFHKFFKRSVSKNEINIRVVRVPVSGFASHAAHALRRAARVARQVNSNSTATLYPAGKPPTRYGQQ